jgi:molecular chaperone DnaJ
VKGDPYKVLGVRRGASSEELHDAYRRLVKLHHPDRNGGSAEATRRFQEIQEAYETVRAAPRGRARPASASSSSSGGRPQAGDESVESRMERLERELREARDAAREAVREAAGGGRRPSDEELGYYTTDDSFAKILADVKTEVADRFSDARKHPAVQRVADLVDGLDGLTSRFERRDKP